MFLVTAWMFVHLFTQVISSSPIPSLLPCFHNCSCQDYEDNTSGVTGGFYASCNGPSDYEEVIESLPANVTFLRLEEKVIQNISGFMFQRFSQLKDLILEENEIENISEDGFRNLTELSRISLGGNMIETFPWSCFEYLPKLSLLDLKNNRIKVLPGRNPLVMSRLKSFKVLDLYPNEHITCSCDSIAFASTLRTMQEEMSGIEGGFIVKDWEKINCKSVNGWIESSLGNISRSKTFHDGSCVLPKLNVGVKSSGENDSGSSWTKLNENATLWVNETSSFACILGDRTNSDETFMKMFLFGNEFVIDKMRNITAPSSYVKINPKSFRFSPGHVRCSLEDFTGTYSSGVYVDIPTRRREETSQMIPTTLPITNPSSTYEEEVTTTVETTATTIPSTTINNQIKYTTFYNERCGVKPDFKMALIRSVITNKTSFEYHVDTKLTVFLSLHEEHKAVDVEFVRSGEKLRELTICHTFGPRMLRVSLRKRKKRQLYSIMINSYNPKFIVCVILPVSKRGVCGEFIVHNTTARSSLFVMFIVGGFLLGLGVVPLAVATSYHVWDKRQQRARGRSYDREANETSDDEVIRYQASVESEPSCKLY